VLVSCSVHFYSIPFQQKCMCSPDLFIFLVPSICKPSENN
jgi:hypothetical protein